MLLIATLLVVAYRTNWVVTGLVLLVITSFAVADLVRYVEKSNREFADFLLSIRSSDFTKYSEVDNRGSSFTGLKAAFNGIADEFQNVRIDKEAHYIFLQTVVTNLNTAIIAFDSKGDVKLMNDAAKLILNVPFMNNISHLQKASSELYERILAGTNGVIETNSNGQQSKLLLRSTEFMLQDNTHRLVLITDIRSEIAHTEIEAWEQLLHVLTHEIMNSITPVSSLSGTIKTRLDDMVERQVYDGETLDDMVQGLQVIENRSAGLISFVNNYKSLITLPKPDIKPLNVYALFDRIRLLMETNLDQSSITLAIDVKNRSLSVLADEHMIEQVLLNLVNNAIDALVGIPDSYIRLSGEIVNEKVTINVEDNGSGIDSELLSRVFIPFFTTKQKGTGIGLSLSKQVLRLHNGNLEVYSMPGERTIFSLVFP